MHCAIPSSLKALLELADSGRADEPFAVLFCDEFFKGLATLGTPRHVLLDLRRNFELVGSLAPDVEAQASSLESILRQHDRILGPETGGFANLFRSLIDEGDVSCTNMLDFEALGLDLKTRLAPLGRAALQLQAADDLAIAADLPLRRAAACICLLNIQDWLGAHVTASLLEREPLRDVSEIFMHHDQLDALSVAFIQSDLTRLVLREFALWYLAHNLTRDPPPDPMRRRLVDTFLSRAELPSLSVFERGFVLKS